MIGTTNKRHPSLRCGLIGLVALLGTLVWGMPTQAEIYHLHGEDGAPLWAGEGIDLQRVFRPTPLHLKAQRIVRVGMRWDGPSHLEWQARFRKKSGAWSAWFTLRTTWNESSSHNSHVDPPQGWASEVEVRVLGEGHPSFVAIELIGKLGPLAVPYAPSKTGKPLPSAPNPGPLGVSGPYNPRSAWKAARAKCSSRDATKNRIAIHHTVSPNNDTMSPEARLRGIQSFHQNTRGWCDVGYHILISQDGRAWEGRPADTLGAHVGSQNRGALGISFIGTFTSVTPNNKMLCTGAKLIDWAVKQFGISRNRTSIMGHRQFPGNSTACPGDKLYALIGSMITQSSQSGNCSSVTPPKCDNVRTANLSGGRLNIRKSSTAQSQRLGDMPEGTCLKVLAKTDKGQSVRGNTTWYQINYQSIKGGWISGYYANCSTCKPPTEGKGTLKGLVYDKKVGKTKKLAGAKVEISGASAVTTGTDGSFSASLAPKSYTLKVSLSGYKTASVQSTVTADKTTNVEIALEPTTGPPQDIEAPKIVITAPKDGATVSTSFVQVTGTITDNDSVSKAELNGTSLTLGAKGEFALRVNLQPGQQTLQVSAWDPSGNRGTEQVTVVSLASGEGSGTEPTTDAPQTEQTANDAGSQDTSSTDTTSPLDDTPTVLDSGATGQPCKGPSDCSAGYVCDNGVCTSNLVSGLAGGCQCNSQGSNNLPLGILFLVGWLAWMTRRKRRRNQEAR